MYVCLCNPFTDKDVKTALENPEVRNTPAQVYKACAGKGPNCGSCLCMVKDMIVDHQSALGVQKIIEDMPALPVPVLAE
jgi:bacterioferritin-associated ferredoxin